MTQALQTVIDNAWEQRTSLSAASAPAEIRDAVNHIIDALDGGKLRVLGVAADRRLPQLSEVPTIEEALGFPFDRGRLDESLHPFTEGVAGDIRVTADLSVPSGTRVEDLGINFREMVGKLLADHVAARMPQVIAAYMGGVDDE